MHTRSNPLPSLCESTSSCFFFLILGTQYISLFIFCSSSAADWSKTGNNYFFFLLRQDFKRKTSLLPAFRWYWYQKNHLVGKCLLLCIYSIPLISDSCPLSLRSDVNRGMGMEAIQASDMAFPWSSNATSPDMVSAFRN